MRQTLEADFFQVDLAALCHYSEAAFSQETEHHLLDVGHLEAYFVHQLEADFELASRQHLEAVFEHAAATEAAFFQVEIGSHPLEAEFERQLEASRHFLQTEKLLEAVFSEVVLEAKLEAE